MRSRQVVLLLGTLVLAGCQAPSASTESPQTELPSAPLEEIVEASEDIGATCPDPDGFVWDATGEPKTIADLRSVLDKSIGVRNEKGGVERDLTSGDVLLHNHEFKPYFTFADWEWDPALSDFSFISSREADKDDADALPGLYRLYWLMEEQMDPESEALNEGTLPLYENVGSAEGFFFFDPESFGPVAITLNEAGLVAKICTEFSETPMKNFELSYGLTDLEWEVIRTIAGQQPE
jgi:hypothetical protein